MFLCNWYDVEVESRTNVKFGVEPEISSHQFYETFTDRESKSSPSLNQWESTFIFPTNLLDMDASAWEKGDRILDLASSLIPIPSSWTENRISYSFSELGVFEADTRTIISPLDENLHAFLFIFFVSFFLLIFEENKNKEEILFFLLTWEDSLEFVSILLGLRISLVGLKDLHNKEVQFLSFLLLQKLFEVHLQQVFEHQAPILRFELSGPKKVT